MDKIYQYENGELWLLTKDPEGKPCVYFLEPTLPGDFDKYEGPDFVENGVKNGWLKEVATLVNPNK